MVGVPAISPRLQRFLGCLPAVRQELLRHLEPSSCIETGRLVYMLMREWRLPARLVPVEVRIANAPAMALIRRDQLTPAHHGKDGVYVVTVGEPAPSPPGRWAGHLAVACESLLIDPSIDQANRPEFGIQFQSPWVQRVPRGFWAQGGLVGTTDEHGTRVEYLHHFSNRGYLGTPAWRKAPRLLPAARMALRGAMAGASSRVQHAPTADA